MNDDVLVSYLDDHLTGAEGALSLLARLEERYAGQRLGPFFTALRAEIQADRDELQALRGRFGATSTAVQQTMGWLGETMSRVRIDFLGPASDARRLFESLEALALGVLGKRALWHALREAPPDPRLRATDIDRLERRALDQYERVERERLAAAKEAFR